MQITAPHTAQALADLLNTGRSQLGALAELGIDPDDVMSEHDCLPLGDPHNEIIDLCDGTYVKRHGAAPFAWPDRTADLVGGTWQVHHYEQAKPSPAREPVPRVIHLSKRMNIPRERGTAMRTIKNALGLFAIYAVSIFGGGIVILLMTRIAHYMWWDTIPAIPFWPAVLLALMLWLLINVLSLKPTFDDGE